MNLSHVARAWQMSGVSVIPILANQTKRPAVKWAEYQIEPPTLGQVEQWWGNGKPYGIAVICGQVSGNLEMTEIEGRACGGELMTRVMEQVDAFNLRDLWDRLTGPSGYSEMSPSGGIHLLYRVGDEDVPGNTKIAQSADSVVLAETRGEGGYVIVAPTPGICHPSGEAWVLLQGEAGRLPVISWAERCALHRALYLALDDNPDRLLASPTDSPLHSSPNRDDPPSRSSSPLDIPAHTLAAPSTDLAVPSRSPLDPTPLSLAPPAPPTDPAQTCSSRYDSTDPVTPTLSSPNLSPGDHFEQVTDWSEILEPHGWSLHSRHGPERWWTRPDKPLRDGHSATTGYASDRDRLYVFSTSTAFPTEQSLTKFAAYTILNFGGNYQLAASNLAQRGFGYKPPPPELGTVARPEPNYEFSHKGNARRLMDRIRGRFHYLVEEKTVIRWDGVSWAPDATSSLIYEFNVMVDEEQEKARQRGDEQAVKFWIRCGNMPQINGCLSALMGEPGYQIQAKDLDRDRHLVNLGNGVYDLITHELQPHDAELKMTKTMRASYDPQATCPQFEGFMEKVLPDPQTRSYVQRALGYSLLGDADRRSLFLVCGPSGTGKSTLMSAMELLFGDYGATAPPGTLRAAGRDSNNPSNDLHTLMGKRFVSTSETNEYTSYNEDLIKRLTGRDTIRSRELYQKFQEWQPRCTIWLATNHAPRFNSDDDAIWRRAKIIPFHTVLLDEDEIPDFAHKILAHELDGILNWLLVGLKEYQAHGLMEPELVQDEVQNIRIQSDPVSRFVEDRVSDGFLTKDPEIRVKSTELYSMYTSWARTVGERALGTRRFANRLSSSYPELDHVKVNGNYFWQGLGRSTSISAEWLIQGYNP